MLGDYSRQMRDAVTAEEKAEEKLGEKTQVQKQNKKYIQNLTSKTNEEECKLLKPVNVPSKGVTKTHTAI